MSPQAFAFADSTEADEIAAFLAAHEATSMFLLGNLLRYGMRGGHPYAIGAWTLRDGQGAITDVAAQTRRGFLNPQCPTAPWPALRRALAGQRLAGVVGPASQVRPLVAALGLAGAPTRVDKDEPFLQLDLSDLTVPEGPGRLVPIAQAPRAALLDWIAAYEVETLGQPAAMSAMTAQTVLDRYVQSRSHVVLMDGAVSLAMTGFNAVTGRTVQIGGVYTPPARRGQGHARRALALHLAEARASGVRTSVLSASGEPALCAYRALGYREIDRWALVFFDGEAEVPA